MTAARDAGVNLAFLGANAMFRRTRLQASTLGAAREVVCYKTSYTEDPMYGKDHALVTSDWREPPNSDPESSLIGTHLRGLPGRRRRIVVSARRSWVFPGTGVPAGASFPHLVGVEYDRVNPGLPGAAADRGAVPLAADLPGRVQLRRLRLLHARRRGRASSTAARCAGWRRSTATSRTASAARTPAFVRQVTDQRAARVRRRPAAAKYPARDNLDAMHEYAGDPIGNPANLQ